MKKAIIIGGFAVVLSLGLFAIAWFVLFVVAYILPAIANRDDQDFARKGIHLTEPAAEMDSVFSDCRHYITYGGEQSHPVWNSVAYFGGRYELTMQVLVRIESELNGEMAGSAEFFLLEISSVRLRPDGTVDGVSYGTNHRFDDAEWKKVMESEGDFDSIGIDLNPKPVTNFHQYAASTRRD